MKTTIRVISLTLILIFSMNFFAVSESLSSFMGYLKGKSSLMIYEQFGNLKFKYKGREFWCRGYYVDTVGKNKEKIAEYIRHQLEEDKLGDQMTMFGKDDDPFKGGK